MSTYKRLSFTNDEEKELIEFVKNHPAIWDASCIEYGNQAKRNIYWKSIAMQLNKKVVECRRKWRFIRDYYVHRRKRDVNGKKKPESKYSNIHFLDKVMMRQQKYAEIFEPKSEHDFEDEELEEELGFITDASNVGSPSKETNLNTTQLTINEEHEYLVDDESSTETEIEIVHQMQKADSSQQNQNISEYLHEEDENVIESVEEIVQTSQPLSTVYEKSIDLFFESMAATVKTFPAHIVTQAKMKVFSVINELEEQLYAESK